MIWSIFHTLTDWHVSVAFNWDFFVRRLDVGHFDYLHSFENIVLHSANTGWKRENVGALRTTNNFEALRASWLRPFLLDGGKNDRRGTKGRTDNMIIGVGYWFNFNIVSDWWCWWLLRQDEYYLEWSECTLEWQHWRFSEELIADIHQSLLFLEHTHVWHAC